jgi:FecR protein
MAQNLLPATALYRALLLATALLGATALPTAAAPVGVTSATDGDPLGKPPADAERVLRVGIDVQASEVITTKANDRAHLVFLDGTSLTVGPNALLTVDKFVFDPDTKKGELAINASKGVFRLVGGKISKTAPINITTPSSTIGIRGGITVFTVTPAETVSTFVFGYSMVVSGHGRSENVTRAGSQVTTIFGNAPGMPTLLPTGGLASIMTQFEGTNGNSNKKGAADRGAQSFGLNNSGKGPNFNSNYTFTLPNPNSNLLTNIVANTNGAENATGLSQQSTAKAIPVVTPPPTPPPYCPPPSYGDGFRDRDGFRGRDGFRDGFRDRDGSNFAGRRH